MTTVELVPLPGNALFLARLNQIKRRAVDMTPAMAIIMKSLELAEAHRFAAEGPDWEPLAPSTVAYRQSHGFGPAHPILERTGALKDSFTGFGDGTSIASAGFMEVSSHVDYAIYHQDGMGNNPRREIMKITPATLVLWREILQGYLLHGITRSVDDDAIAMTL